MAIKSAAVPNTTRAPMPESKAPDSLIVSLERLALNAERSGDAVMHALLSEVAVAAGMLKYKTGAAIGRLSGAAGDLIESLHALL